MVGPGLFSVIYTSKYGFVASSAGNRIQAVLATVAAHTAGQYGLGLGSKSVLHALSLAMKVVAESSELSNWFATLGKYMLQQIADQKKHKSEEGQEKEGAIDAEELLHVSVSGSR